MTIQKHLPRLLLILATSLIASMALAGIASARALVRDTRTWTNGRTTITFSVPETYSSCTSQTKPDRVYTRGIPRRWRLLGQVDVYFITENGPQLIQRYPVDQLGNLNLIISYPALATWPTLSNGIREIHVSPSIEVYSTAGYKIGWVGGDLKNAPGTFGPGGQDWDVYCYGSPKPTGTPDNTKTPTTTTVAPTSTPNSCITTPYTYPTFELAVTAVPPSVPVNLAAAPAPALYPNDLAWNKPTFASSYWANYYPSGATDGTLVDQWISAGSNGTWFYVDLLTSQSVGSFITTSYVDRNLSLTPRTYFIASNDLIHWQILVDETNLVNADSRPERRFNLPQPVVARYIGLYAIEWNGGWGDQTLFAVFPPAQNCSTATPKPSLTPFSTPVPPTSTPTGTATNTPIATATTTNIPLTSTPTGCVTTPYNYPTFQLALTPQTGSVPVNLSPAPAPPFYASDLAWNKPAFASSYWSAYYPSGANSGTLTNPWVSAGSSGTWFYVDLLSSQSISTIATRLYVDRAVTSTSRTYFIASNDLTNWQVLVDETRTITDDERAERRYILPQAVTARYVGIYAVNWQGAWGEQRLFAVFPPAPNCGTATPEPSLTPSGTPVPLTNTPTLTASQTGTATETPTPTSTPTATGTATPTNTPGGGGGTSSPTPTRTTCPFPPGDPRCQ